MIETTIPQGVTASDLISLYTGDQDTRPCHRLHLAAAIIAHLAPRSYDDLELTVYPGGTAPPHALDVLSAAYDNWRLNR